MVHDCNWPTDTEFKECIGSMKELKFCMIRTCKANTCCGLVKGQGEELSKKDSNWMVNGNYGIIQLNE